MSDKPNIIFLMSDQQKSSATGGPFGNTIVKTPFWDSMATRGLACTQAFTSSPVCAPSRSSIHLGVHPLVHGVLGNQHKAPVNMKQLSEYLIEAGYFTAVAGHYENKNNLSRGWHNQQPSLAHGKVWKPYLDWIQSGTPSCGWSSGTLKTDDQHGHSKYVADKALQQIAEAEESKMPFFLHVCFEDPHPPYFAIPPYHKMIDPKRIKLPDANANHYGRPDWQKKFMKELGSSRATESDIRQQLATYYGMIAYADSQMQRIYNDLERRGLLENTWFVLTSDHGDYGGEKGLYTKGENLYECLLHVPLIIIPPVSMQNGKGGSYHHMVDLIDIFPSILNMAGIQSPEYAQGKSLLPLFENQNIQYREHLFAQCGQYMGSLKNTLPAGMAEYSRRHELVMGIRTHTHSLVIDPEYGNEAYDLKQDPFELHNLFLLNAPLHDELKYLEEKIYYHQETCSQLQKSLNVIPGHQAGNYPGWE